MSGALWAVLAGVGFGLFQTVNRRAVRGMDVFVATFIQLAVSAVILVVASLATEPVTIVWTAPAMALINFGLAGLFHFVIGWTLLNASQKRIGAARTSPLIGTTPLFGTAFAVLALREVPSSLTILGILTIVGGIYLISTDAPERNGMGSSQTASDWTGVTFGLGAAMVWAISPIFIRVGLSGLPSPLLGVTVSMVVSAAAYGIALWASRRPWAGLIESREVLVIKLLAGVLVGFSVWARWIALALAPVGVVLALALMSVPVVMLLSPLVVGRHLERVTSRLWAGASLTVSGAVVLVLIR
ncbi:MAG: DMT family transporter [Armatimonadetes bacterium]|nr:DMT family transporter [Armatimonadota bacterium]